MPANLPAQSETGECPITGTVECDCGPARPEFPDGASVFAGPDAWPVVTVRFPDGIQVDFRAGSEWPRSAHVRASALEIKGHRQRYDADAYVKPDGTLATIAERIGWKTGVSGVDGAGDIPAKVTQHLSALVRRRAREARAAMRTAAGARAAAEPRAKGKGGGWDAPDGEGSGAIADARATRDHMREWAAGETSHPGEDS
jgi:hypothetical protein